MNTTTLTTTTVIYQCGGCDERTTERRCEDCNLFTRRLGAGGHCPHCDEPVLADELLNPEPLTTKKTPSHTDNLTGSARPPIQASCTSPRDYAPRGYTSRAPP